MTRHVVDTSPARHWRRPRQGSVTTEIENPTAAEGTTSVVIVLVAKDESAEQHEPTERGEDSVEVRGHLAVYGEGFLIEVGEEAVHLVHPRWSLSGAGATLAEAELDLIQEAQQLAEALVEVPSTELDEEARAMRDFALAFLTMETR